MDPVEYVSLPSEPPYVLYPLCSPASFTTIVPTAPPANPCMLCNESVFSEYARFPCGCHLYIHRECAPIWRQNNHTCPLCHKIIINILPEPRMGHSLTRSTYIFNKALLCFIGVLMVVGFLIFLIAIIHIAKIEMKSQ
jgi:hypothetical protein